jgi:hypothetical protein
MVEDFKIMITGGDDFADYRSLSAEVDKIIDAQKPDREIVIISGAAPGEEMLGERYAAERGLEVAEFFASLRETDYGTWLRLEEMSHFADACLCFWYG